MGDKVYIPWRGIDTHPPHIAHRGVMFDWHQQQLGSVEHLHPAHGRDSEVEEHAEQHGHRDLSQQGAESQWQAWRNKGSGLFNNALNTFYLRPSGSHVEWGSGPVTGLAERRGLFNNALNTFIYGHRDLT